MMTNYLITFLFLFILLLLLVIYLHFFKCLVNESFRVKTVLQCSQLIFSIFLHESFLVHKIFLLT